MHLIVALKEYQYQMLKQINNVMVTYILSRFSRLIFPIFHIKQ